MKKIIAILFLLSLAGCDDPKEARKTLIKAGYEPVQVGGYSFWMCGKDDTFATKFTAINPKGQIVTGVVCSNLFEKGSTIRF